MADFFIPLHPGIYRSGSLVMILDAAQRPSREAGKPLALWLKARRDVLARKVRLGIYVVEDPVIRADLEATAPKAAKAWPFPRAIAASFAEAEQAALAKIGERQDA